MTRIPSAETTDSRELGQTAVEYAAVLLLVGIVVITAISTGFLGLLAGLPGRITGG